MERRESTAPAIEQNRLVLSISVGARGLLHIAKKNDIHGGLSKNALLFNAVRVCEDLFWRRDRRDSASIVRELGLETASPTFLVVVGAVLRRIREAAETQFVRCDTNGRWIFVNDFDSFVLHAVAQTLADLGWPQRRAEEFDGPSCEQLRRQLDGVSFSTFCEVFLRNYFGNLLQDYFKRAEVRRAHPNLPPDREVQLRSSDAQEIVDQAVEHRRLTGRTLGSAQDVSETVEAIIRALD
jgi:hypothetical protein